MMRYPITEKFKAPQGEGLYTGTPMAFIRFVGCSVGQKVCTACDTDFSKMITELGGGMFTAQELKEWARPYEHICLTGGEPLDRDLRELILTLTDGPVMCHIETSGTVDPIWLNGPNAAGHWIMDPINPEHWIKIPLWLCVSPKPGYLEKMLLRADEIKYIHGGLGDGPGWMTLGEAVRWADDSLVFLQQRNDRLDINGSNLKEALKIIDLHPSLRLSVQLHKFLRTR